MMHEAPEVLRAFLDHLTEALIVYLCYQIDSGAQASVWKYPSPPCLSTCGGGQGISSKAPISGMPFLISRQTQHSGTPLGHSLPVLQTGASSLIAVRHVVAPASQLLSWLSRPMSAWVLAEQVVQIFDSWAHTLTPEQFTLFSLPYAQKVIEGVREKRPGTPIMFHANGGKPSCLCMSTASPGAVPVQHLQHPDVLSLALHPCWTSLGRLCLHAGACWCLDSMSESTDNYQIQEAHTLLSHKLCQLQGWGSCTMAGNLQIGMPGARQTLSMLCSSTSADGPHVHSAVFKVHVALGCRCGQTAQNGRVQC